MGRKVTTETELLIQAMSSILVAKSVTKALQRLALVKLNGKMEHTIYTGAEEVLSQVANELAECLVRAETKAKRS